MRSEGAHGNSLLVPCAEGSVGFDSWSRREDAGYLCSQEMILRVHEIGYTEPPSKQPLRGKQVCLMHHSFSLKKMYRYKNGEENRRAMIYLEFQISFGKFPPLSYYNSDSLGKWRLI